MRKGNFIKVVLLISVCGLFISSFYSCKTSTPQKNIGLQLWSVRDSVQVNVPRTIEKIGSMGYKFIEAADYFNKYPGRFKLWHIKDKQEIGASGNMDFAPIFAAAARSGMKYGIVEVEEYNFDQFTSCIKSLDFLNSQSYIVMPN